MSDEETAVALQQPGEAPACSGCRGPLIVEAYFCHQCGVRVRPDDLPTPRLIKAMLLAVVGLWFGCYGLVELAGNPWVGLVLLAVAFPILREVRNLLR